DPVPPAADLAGGRLLIYEPGSNLCDGAAAVETEGFFDGDNMPPWDTGFWVGDKRVRGRHRRPRPYTHLLGWVPPRFLDAADDGIKVNPEQCIYWASVDAWVEHADERFALELRALGLLP